MVYDYKLTVENEPSPRIFPNLKSSGLFFLIGCDVVDDDDDDVRDSGREEVEFKVDCCKHIKQSKA